MKKKNCFSCKYLEYEPNEEEYSSSDGYFVCHKREESKKLTSNLQRNDYLNKSKVCYEIGLVT